jgi:hypothetical protein
MANIGPRERRKRLFFGVGVSAVSVAILVVLCATGANRLWRLALFLPSWIAAIGVYQARGKT